jgi:hypothetical protein
MCVNVYKSVSLNTYSYVYVCVDACMWLSMCPLLALCIFQLCCVIVVCGHATHRKRQAEREIERSGLDYTIIRPGG